MRVDATSRTCDGPPAMPSIEADGDGLHGVDDDQVAAAPASIWPRMTPRSVSAPRIELVVHGAGALGAQAHLARRTPRR